MQIGTTVATGNAVQRDQGVGLVCRAAQQDERLLLVASVEAGIGEHIIGPQAGLTAITPLTPEQRVATLAYKCFAGTGEGLACSTLDGQFVGHRADLTAAFDFVIDPQAATDLA
ncbi:hypothetical protein D3C72_1691610 [compost metagenome]